MKNSRGSCSAAADKSCNSMTFTEITNLVENSHFFSTILLLDSYLPDLQLQVTTACDEPYFR